MCVVLNVCGSECVITKCFEALKYVARGFQKWLALKTGVSKCVIWKQRQGNLKRQRERKMEISRDSDREKEKKREREISRDRDR